MRTLPNPSRREFLKTSAAGSAGLPIASPADASEQAFHSNAYIFINPDLVAAQIEGGVVFGLISALYDEITIQNGQVQQTNFDNYPMLRIADMPKVEVHLVPSHESPGGIGQPGVPSTAPAVANAIFAATGKRLRSLPFQTQELAMS
jgi:CO/xanthine dehydrogenase Mo-binding subunit